MEQEHLLVHSERCSYDLPYEKVGKNEPVCITDEVLFEIFLKIENEFLIPLLQSYNLSKRKYCIQRIVEVGTEGNGIPNAASANSLIDGCNFIVRH